MTGAVTAWLRCVRQGAGDAASRLRARGAARGVVLLYHRVAEPASDPWGLAVAPENFAAQMAALAARGTAASLGTLAASTRVPGPRMEAVAVTFDDGYADTLHQALPVLEGQGVPATVYVPSAAVGDPSAFWWDALARLVLEPPVLPERLGMPVRGTVHSWELGRDARPGADGLRRLAAWRADHEAPPSPRAAAFLEAWEILAGLHAPERAEALGALAQGVEAPPPDRHGRPVDGPEFRRLAASPVIEIGGHTANHVDLSRIPADRAKDEIARDRSALAAMTGRAVESFAYPYGRIGPTSRAEVAAAGYGIGVCSVRGLVTPASDPLLLPRVQVPDIDGRAFGRMLDTLLGRAPAAAA